MRALPITYLECEAIYARTDGLRTVLFASASPEEGNSTVAYAVAQRAAANGQKVLLIDFNTHRSYPRDVLGIPATSWALDREIPKEAIYRPGPASVDILPAPIERTFAVEARQPTHVAAMLKRLLEDYDLIIGDGPSLTRMNGSGIGSIGLSTAFDGVILTVAASETDANEVERAVERLTDANAAIVGCILNDRINPNLRFEIDRQFAKFGKIGRVLARLFSPITTNLLISEERF